MKKNLVLIGMMGSGKTTIGKEISKKSSLKFIDTDLLIENHEFENWVLRHEHVLNKGIQFVPESNDLMRGSYAMLDALGRFYSNESGGHVYGPSLLDVGVLKAWEENVFIEQRFNERGGIYEWTN